MADTPSRTDAELAAAYREGDTDAFAELYDRTSSAVFSYFLDRGQSRETAADSTNDVFADAAERLDAGESPVDSREWLLGLAADAVDAEPTPPTSPVPAPPALRARVLDRVEREVAAALSSGPPSLASLDPEWVRWGSFVVVTLVVSLIGFAVSARFEPLDPLPTVPVEETPEVSASTTTSTSTPDTPSTTTGDSSDATSTTVTASPASFEVSTETIDFGGDGTVNEFDLTNTGGQPGTFRVSVSTEAIAVSAGEGEVDGGDTVTIEMSLDREEIEEGEIDETVTISWEGGESAIALTGTHEANPILHNPQASPATVEVAGDDACSNTQTTISVRVRDNSPLESVVARWSPDGGTQRETELSSVGNDMFEGTIGPFTTAQTAEVRVVAFDDRGNAGGASATVSVVDCP